ncbi:MAG: hypothetical protein ABIK18_00590 [candidate division WOR-3 bacterium]
MAKGWALISVWDKSGLKELAEVILRCDYRLLATSNTAQFLRQVNLNVTEVSKWTNAPEILGGRVKTIHPKIAAGILSLRGNEGIEPIDIVVCNLYPFLQGVKEKKDLQEMIELIDIGGVTLLRSAAKNWRFVVPVPEPKYYPLVINELQGYGAVRERVRLQLARATFELTSSYDQEIANYFAKLVKEDAQI